MTHADTAAGLVLGNRNESYGNPADDFDNAGLIWTALMRRAGLLKPNAFIRGEMVALCMTGLKLNRHAHKPKDDNIADAHGYLLCLEWIENEQRPTPRTEELEKTIEGLRETIEDVAVGRRCSEP